MSDLRAMVAHVGSLPSGANLEQLTAKVKTISEAIKKDATTLPKRIKEIIAQNFMDMGWDVTKQRVTNVTKFSLVSFRRTLSEISAQLENWSPPVVPTAEELAELSLACEKLWELDCHRLVPDVDYVLNLQQGKKAYDQGDFAQLPLFHLCRREGTAAAYLCSLRRFVRQLRRTNRRL